MVNLILCGGSGTRLWPISRTLMPKQFARLFNGTSLFQKTVEKNSKLCSSQFIVSNADQYFLAKDQIGASYLKATKFLLEPIGRNTAPAIALACLNLDPNAIVLVTPSDHVIKNTDAYMKVLERARTLASEGFLVTFGIKPTSPETGYGYIESKGEDVIRFVEKPNAEQAQKYLEAGNFLWNSGIFCFKASTFLDELQKYSPDILKASKAANNNLLRQSESLLMGVRCGERDK